MEILVRIVKMTMRYRVRLGLSYLTFFLSVGLSLLIVKFMGDAVNKVVITGDDGSILIGDPQNRTLILLGLAILVASLLRGFNDFVRTYTSDSLAQKVAYDLRNELYDKYQHMSFAFHDKEHTGDLMSKATADVEAVRRFIMMGLVRSLEVGLRVIAVTAILIFLNWELTLICLAFVPFMLIRSTIVMRTFRRMATRVQVIMGQSVTVLQENLAGINVVKAFSAEEHEGRKYAAKARELQQAAYGVERMQGTESAMMTLVFTVGLGLILWYGGWEVIRGDLDAGGLAMFVLLLNQLTFPVRMTPFIINSFSRAVASGRRLFDVLDAQSPVEERANAGDMGRAYGHVEFENVSFSYNQGEPALKNIDLSVPQGSVVALLGAPGSGKSTIVNLLPRFYDVTDGQITIDGHDIREFTLASLRRNVGIVQQDVYLFQGTIKSNISYGSMDASFDQIEQAAQVAQLHGHIGSLPGEYDTWVGERGVTLSGGQRQRLSIARTILIDPPILILDDSTSSVDVETERLIHRAMTEVMRGRTTFVIAHRLSTVRQADMILVLRDGEIVEKGNHDELIALDGIYRDIYELQLRPQEETLLDATLPAEAGPQRMALAGDDGGDS